MINKDKLLDNAHKLLVKGQLPKAIGEYQKLVDAFPRDFRLRLKLAELLTRERRPEEARPHYEAVARHFDETGFHLKAIAIHKQIQKNEPGRSESYLRVAELYEKQGLAGNALNEYRGLVAFYERQRLPREALRILYRMVALDPAHLATRCQLIDALLALEETTEALGQFHELLRALDGRGEHAGMVRCFEKYPGLVPEDLEHRLPYARALLLSGQAERALPLLKALSGQASGHAALLSLLSDCYLALGRPAEAAATCRQLFELQPANLGLCERYLRLCIEGGCFREALAGLEAWRSDFIGAGRVEVFRELAGLLDAASPGNPRLRAMLACEPAGWPPPSGAGAELLPAPRVAAGPEPAPRLESADDDSPAALEPTAAPGAGAALPGELELELEFDLDELRGSPSEPPVAGPTPADSLPPAAAVDLEAPVSSMELPEFTELDFDLELLEPVDNCEHALPAATAPAGSGPAATADDAVACAAEAEPCGVKAGAAPAAGDAEADDLEAALFVTEMLAGDAGLAGPAAAGAGDDEYQSHFDLGIGFKEMGMFEAAVSEFGKASAGEFRIADCLTLMAQCRLAMGEPATAEALYKEALCLPELSDAARIALRYELGLLYENTGRLLEAMESFQFVIDRDRFYREVTGKLAALRQALGLDEPGEPPSSGPGRHNRISYV